MKNPGKQFEEDFKESIPDSCYYQRIADPAQSFGGGNLRFSVENPYDCFMYRYPFLYCFELKSKKTSSLSYWREDFVVPNGSKCTFDIKRNQIEGLRNAVSTYGVIAGFVINFRTIQHTYFLPIRSFDKLTTDSTKKSINEKDILTVPHMPIEQQIKRVRYSYNIDKLIKDLGELQHEQA